MHKRGDHMKTFLFVSLLSVLLLGCDQGDDKNIYTAKPYQGDAGMASSGDTTAAPEAAPAEPAASTDMAAAEPAASTETAAAEPAPMAKTEAKTSDGKAIYNGTCVGCHGTGAAGAPKLGDKASWAPRIAKGKDALYQSALHGVPGTAMMAKGTCASCSEDDLKAAVDYMVSQSQ